LYNVVVDTESTGEQLLQNGNLRRRVTIIPLNKIQPYVVTSRVQDAAVELVGDCNFLSVFFMLLNVSIA
jgi:structural maintenance of chromosome 2